ncbi:LysM peptidoglycan-binding domain-containing protein [Marinobacteraceae bacterium S3BR75-40.1]
MRKLLYALTATMLLASSWVFAAPELRPDHPEKYTVVKGDTLWDISARFLKNPWYWPEIWHDNPQIDNPHLIYPGDVLALVYIDGKPRVTKVAENAGPKGVVKLSPKVRSTPIETPVPTIPLDAIQGFLTQTRVVDEAILEDAPYVLEGRDGRIASGAGDRVYARGDVGNQKVMSVYRRGETYVDPETNEFLGLEARAIGKGNIAAVDGEVITVDLTRTSEEVGQGDRLLHTENRSISTTFEPSAPDTKIEGRMISVLDGVSNIGQYDVVVINRGEREGLEEGNVLAVYKAGQVVRDPKTRELVELPSERAGLLMVFRTFEKVSYGLVLQSTRPLSLMDKVRNP